MFEGMTWLNEPPDWSVDSSGLHVVTAESTDFWRSTFYGFVHDDGHFLAARVPGDFTVVVTLNGRYEHLYDQCGLMVRSDERCWLKAGVEFTDGAQHLSTVVTREFSDWSVAASLTPTDDLRVRVTRHGEALLVQYSVGRGEWGMLRLAYLDMPGAVDVGVMCCSPLRSGFHATFSEFEIGPPVPRELHA